MNLITRRAQFLVDCLNLPEAAQVDDAKWEEFQLAHLCDDSMFRIEHKARQIGWSCTVAAEATASAVLDGESTIFVSINLDEAAEKIRYTKRVYENLHVREPYVLPEIVTDNVLALDFDNGARIMSRPSRPPRGKAKMHIVLDELAHVMHDRAIYTASLPIIARGGRLRIGSSPMGAGGIFWEITEQELREYPGYTRVETPWWKVRAFCKEGILPPEDVYAMPTAERVERYGNERIHAIFDNMPLDDFRQEFECVYIDESISYFPWALIRKNQDPDLLCWHIKDVDDVHAVAREMKAAVAARQIEDRLVGGMDVGRKHNLTEIILLGLGVTATPVRLMVSLDSTVDFKAQEACVQHLLKILPIVGFLIDENGLGMQLAEDLSAHPSVDGATFTNQSKGWWATELKIQMESSNVPIPCDKDLAYQIHSVKRKISAARNNIYDTERNEKHHADKMWALALAVWAAKEDSERPTYGPALTWVRRT